MAIINFGSLNIDHTYSVDHFVRPGETMQSLAYHTYCGGKGLNQSLAAARAGSRVCHAGLVGPGGQMLLDALTESGADVSHVAATDVPQGHAVIQVNAQGENCILLFPGSNFALTRADVDRVFASVSAPGYVMLQNEVSQLPYIIERAHAAGFSVVLNASPFEDSLLALDYDKLSWLMINEIEGRALTGAETPEDIADAAAARWPGLGLVLTLGGDGCLCRCGGETLRQPIFKVETVDTTGAGDTFTGYFVSALDQGLSLREAVVRASAAAAISVSRRGAGPSIPTADEVTAFLAQRA